MNKNKNRWNLLWKNSCISDKLYLFNKRSFDEIIKYINFNGLNTIEIGCGTGQLSLLLSQLAKRVTLLDYTENSLKIAKKLFSFYNINNCSFIQKDLFDFYDMEKYDVVLSSGLVEHFEGKKLLMCLNVHKYCAKKNGYVVIIAPSDRWFNKKRCNNPDNIKLFGYWRPISKKKMLKLFENVNLIPLVIKEFDLFYGLRPNVITRFANVIYKMTNFSIRIPLLDNLFGALILGIGKKVD